MDPCTATVIFVQRVSNDTVFASCARRNSALRSQGETGSGILFVSRKGASRASFVEYNAYCEMRFYQFTTSLTAR